MIPEEGDGITAHLVVVIFDKVYIEKREDMFVADACVFPDIDRESAEIKNYS